jgi:hypothetical protein
VKQNGKVKRYSIYLYLKKSFIFPGDWSDKSAKWTSRFKKYLGWQDTDDGIFWMPLEEYIK